MFAMGPAFFQSGAASATLALSGTYAAATVGAPYSSDLTVSGGNGVYSNPRVTVGALPAGLALSIVSGKLRLSGTPTTAATSNFTVAVDSGDGQTATSAQSVVVSAAAIATTWDPVNTASPNTLSNGNLTVTGGAAVRGTRSTTSHASGKFAFQISTPAAYGSVFLIGVVDAGASQGVNVGFSAKSVGMQAGYTGTPVYQQGGSAPATSTQVVMVAGSKAMVAVDATAGKVWIKTQGSTSWCGNGDPATGTAPTWTVTPGTPLFAAASLISPASVVAQFSGAFFEPLPSGYATWD